MGKLLKYDFKYMIKGTIIFSILALIGCIMRMQYIKSDSYIINGVHYKTREFPGITFNEYFGMIDLVCKILLAGFAIFIYLRLMKRDTSLKLMRGYNRIQIYTSLTLSFSALLIIITSILVFTPLIYGHYILGFNSDMTTSGVLFYYINYVIGIFVVCSVVIMMFLSVDSKIVNVLLIAFIFITIVFVIFNSGYTNIFDRFSFNLFAESYDFDIETTHVSSSSTETIITFYKPAIKIGLLIKNFIIMIDTIIIGNLVVSRSDFS